MPPLHAFSDEDRRVAAVLAEQAAIAVTAALRHYDELTLSDHLRAALSSRSVIDQAIGRFFHDLSQTQIAAQVGLSQMHVSRLLAQSLAVLRARLDG